MTCPRYVDLSAYADNMLNPEEHRALAQHVGSCPVCQRSLGEMLALQKGLQALPSPTLGVDLSAAWEERAERRKTPRRVTHSFWSGWGVPGLTVALSLVSGVWLGGLMGGSAISAAPVSMVRVFDPVPPGGLCAAAELCRASKGLQ